MKRSEMVNLMWLFIQEIEDDYDRYMDEETTEKLLTFIEKIGMLPPDRDIIIEKHLCTDNKWDKEDA